ncbi:MAG: glycosyltransferase family 4 protein [bacterium]|nr:glycosyltransferase family 4 protein [bacterium]
MFKKYRLEIIIFLIALILRLAFAGIVYGQSDFNYSRFLGKLKADSWHDIARNLVNNKIYSDNQISPDSVRTPGYPAMIAVSLYIFDSVWPFLIFQVIIGSLLPLLGRKISLEITRNNKISNPVALILAIEPMGIWLSIMLMTETIFTLFFLLFALFFLKFIKINQEPEARVYDNFSHIVLAGLFLGLATLIRPTTFYFPIILIIGWIIYWYFIKHKLLLKYLFAFLTIFSIAVAPWLYRNYKVFGTAELSASQAEVSFCYLAPSVLAIKDKQSFSQAQKNFFKSQGFENCPRITLDKAHWFQSRVIEVSKENPKALARILEISLLTFFTHDGVLNLLSYVNATEPSGLTARQIAAQPWPEILRTARSLIFSPALLIILARALWILIFFLFISGAAYGLIKKKFTVFSAFALACIAYFALTTSIGGFGVNARFRFPVNVFIFVFAIGFLREIINSGKDRISGRARLLILTQKIDLDDDVLGFMHGWVAEFAKRCEKITVIALSAGEYNLPGNVKVLSLGKEEGESKIKYLANFYKYIWRHRSEYDHIFVHMNKEYMLLGWPFWRLWGNKTTLWYNHRYGNIPGELAGLLANQIFFTSPFSFFSRNKKARQMPAGVDTDKFIKNIQAEKIKNSILFLSRISPVKKADVLLRAAKILDAEGIDFILDFVGAPGLKDAAYFKNLKNEAQELEKTGKVKFLGNVSNNQAPAVYNQHRIFVNLTDSGSFDKTILEAMACEIMPLVSSRSYEKVLPPELIFKEDDEKDLAEKLLKVLAMPEPETKILGQKFRQYVLASHSLDLLAGKIAESFINLKDVVK